MNSKIKRTIAATMVLPAALAVAGSALVAGCDNGAGSSTSTPTAPTFSVSITGTTKIDGVLTAEVRRDAGIDGAASYVWKRGTTVIGGNTPTYTLVEADIDQPITVTVSVVGAGVKTSSITPSYPNLQTNGASTLVVENRTTSTADTFFTTTTGRFGSSIVERIVNIQYASYSGITKVILGSVNKKVETVLTINASSINTLNDATLDNSISAQMSAAYTASAKSLDGVRLAGLQSKNGFDGLFRESKKAILQRNNRIAGSQSRQRLG